MYTLDRRVLLERVVELIPSLFHRRLRSRAEGHLTPVCATLHVRARTRIEEIRNRMGSMSPFYRPSIPAWFAGNIYGANFFMATGFHGFHVIVGTIFLAVCLVRVIVTLPL